MCVSSTFSQTRFAVEWKWMWSTVLRVSTLLILFLCSAQPKVTVGLIRPEAHYIRRPRAVHRQQSGSFSPKKQTIETEHSNGKSYVKCNVLMGDACVGAAVAFARICRFRKVNSDHHREGYCLCEAYLIYYRQNPIRFIFFYSLWCSAGGLVQGGWLAGWLRVSMALVIIR